MFGYSRVLLSILIFLEDEDKSAFASSQRDAATDASVWHQIYLHTFGQRLSEPPASGGSMRASRRRSSPRATYFKEMRYLSKNWTYVFMSLHKRDYTGAKLRALLSRWRFPAPHSPTGPVVLSEHQRRVLNKAHASFEWSPLLCVVARFRRWGAVKGLIENYQVDPCAVDARGMNALITAAWCGNLTMVNYLLNRATEEQQAVMAKQKGTPHMTSACGGKGPFNAYRWAFRKAQICSTNIDWHAKHVAFTKVCKLLKKYEAEEDLLKDDKEEKERTSAALAAAAAETEYAAAEQTLNGTNVDMAPASSSAASSEGLDVAGGE